jgi:hypothetical protein
VTSWEGDPNWDRKKKRNNNIKVANNKIKKM